MLKFMVDPVNEFGVVNFGIKWIGGLGMEVPIGVHGAVVLVGGWKQPANDGRRSRYRRSRYAVGPGSEMLRYRRT